MLRALEDTGGTFGPQVMDDADGRTRAMVVERRCGSTRELSMTNAASAEESD